MSYQSQGFYDQLSDKHSTEYIDLQTFQCFYFWFDCKWWEMGKPHILFCVRRLTCHYPPNSSVDQKKVKMRKQEGNYKSVTKNFTEFAV